ncbi:eggshell protein 1-like [Penaeus monodon]|uniref:eggshell protein 1-like n=1 Tax=Penaeus monodon TaxID=6687 RepID=UPI0018A781BF|nr:eggshell protein 1-like [Penaeus monodon]
MRITALFVAVLVALAAMFTATEANPTFFKNKGGSGGKGGGGGKYGGGGGKGGGKFGGGKFGLFGGEGHLFPLFGGLFGKKG